MAFIALPGVVAFGIPLLALRPPAPARGYLAVGFLIAAGGVAGLLWCVREFYVAGRGTLAPWSPPRCLVTTGPYRVSRNPMYLSVLSILAGWALAFRDPDLALYWAIVAAAFHLRVVFFEEPWQARSFGDAWRLYRSRVPRWLTRPGRDRPSV
jgi:protein-S-isoprenylcysteine O-methyltransferase Ste14